MVKIQLIYQTHWSWRKVIGIPLLAIVIGLMVLALDDIFARAQNPANAERVDVPEEEVLLPHIERRPAPQFVRFNHRWMAQHVCKREGFEGWYADLGPDAHPRYYCLQPG